MAVLQPQRETEGAPGLGIECLQPGSGQRGEQVPDVAGAADRPPDHSVAEDSGRPANGGQGFDAAPTERSRAPGRLTLHPGSATLQ